MYRRSKVGYVVSTGRERIELEKTGHLSMFAAVVGYARFGYGVAIKACVGPIGTVAVCCGTEEPGEQRFRQDQRLKQPMGLPFSEWADNNAGLQKILVHSPSADPYSRPDLTEITNGLPVLENAVADRDRFTEKTSFHAQNLQQTSTDFSSNDRGFQDSHG